MPPDTSHAAVYLSAQQVADRLGVTLPSFRNHRAIPPADAVIGYDTVRPIYGWLPATVDSWHAKRTRAPSTPGT